MSNPNLRPKKRWFSSPAAAAMLAAGLLAAPSNLATQETKPQSPQTDTDRPAAEKSGQSETLEALQEDLEQFRKWSAEQNEKAVQTASEMIEELKRMAARSDEALETASEQARNNWEAARKNFQDAMAEAEKRFAELQSAAAENWAATRDAIANALENAASALKQDQKEDPSAAEQGKKNTE